MASTAWGTFGSPAVEAVPLELVLELGDLLLSGGQFALGVRSRGDRGLRVAARAGDLVLGGEAGAFGLLGGEAGRGRGGLRLVLDARGGRFFGMEAIATTCH